LSSWAVAITTGVKYLEIIISKLGQIFTFLGLFLIAKRADLNFHRSDRYDLLKKYLHKYTVSSKYNSYLIGLRHGDCVALGKSNVAKFPLINVAF
jgi:hypothetical protein